MHIDLLKKNNFLLIIWSILFSVFVIGIPHAAYAQKIKPLGLKNQKISSIKIIQSHDIPLLTLADFNLVKTPDTDGDGLSDTIEYTFKTDPLKPDTDGDGYIDTTELLNGYSPLQPDGLRLFFDKTIHDTFLRNILIEKQGGNLVGWYVHPNDKKLYSLGAIKNLQKTIKKYRLLYNPILEELDPARKKIEVNLLKQKLSFYLDDIKLGDMIVSTGNDRGPTPIGTFKVLNKSPRAWSKLAGLWMPNWMAFAKAGKYGIHELPEWPNGKKEGANHLGQRVSHGCIRLGVLDAKFLYAWTPINTKVIVKKS